MIYASSSFFKPDLDHSDIRVTGPYNPNLYHKPKIAFRFGKIRHVNFNWENDFKLMLARWRRSHGALDRSERDLALPSQKETYLEASIKILAQKHIKTKRIFSARLSMKDTE